MPQMQRCSLENTAPTLLDSERSRARGVSAPVHARACIARIMGSYFDPDASRLGVQNVPRKMGSRRPAPTAQGSPWLRREDWSGRDLPGQSGAGQGALPFPRRIVDRVKDRGRPCPHLEGAGRRRWRAYRANQSTKSVGPGPDRLVLTHRSPLTLLLDRQLLPRG
jgi:hypothetical protein